MTAIEVSRLTESAFVGGVPGLELAVSYGGTKSWRLFYRLAGGKRRKSLSLGRYPAVSLAEARKRAGEKLALAADGIDPRAEREAEAEARDFTTNAAIARYLKWCSANNAPRTVEVKRNAFATVVAPAIGKQPIVEVTRRDIAIMLDDLSDRPALRRSVYLYLSHFFGWCVERDLAATNPVRDLKAPRAVKARDRVLDDGEIAALWQAPGTMATIARLALLTAQRRGSIEAMRWTDVDLETAVWTVPAADMKSGRLHKVPLSRAAIDLLASWPRLRGPFVFGVGSNGEKPFAGSSNGMEALRRKLGGPDWRLHDLRRTAVTLAQRDGCSVEAIRALTQHKLPGVIGVYARHTYEDEKREVVAAIERQVARVIG